MNRVKRMLAATTLTLAVALAPATVLAVPEPDPPAEEGASEGRPVDGYIATCAVMGLALFIVCKTARR